jgi:hypothetical protein
MAGSAGAVWAVANGLRAVRPVGIRRRVGPVVGVQVRDDAVGRVEWTFSVDSTVNRAYQHAAGGRK